MKDFYVLLYADFNGMDGQTETDPEVEETGYINFKEAKTEAIRLAKKEAKGYSNAVVDIERNYAEVDFKDDNMPIAIWYVRKVKVKEG